jgi:hypothetical protein
MGRFWDERAREEAMFFVDDREPYGEAGEARFGQRGEHDLDRLLDTLGARTTRTWATFCLVLLRRRS